MELKTISIQEYRKYLDSVEYADFLQSDHQAEKLMKNGWHVEFVQIVDSEKIVASAMLAMISLMKIFKYCYVPRGIIMDYHNEKVVEDVTCLIRNYLKSKNVVYMEMDPAIILQERDSDGNIVDGGFNNFDVVQKLKDFGYLHLPLKVGYDLSKECRFVSVLDVKDKSSDEVFKNFISKTRQNIKNSIKNNVKIRMLNRNELNILMDLVNKSGEKQHYETFSLDFFESEYDCFKENVGVYLAYLDVQEYVSSIQSNIKKEEETIVKANEVLAENPHSKNSLSRLKVATQNLESLHKREVAAQEIQKEYPNELPLAAAMFLFYKGEVYYLSSGSDERYKNFKGPYALQWYMIQKAINEGYSTYNFYGISGLFEKGDEGYGVFDFKRGFNAVVHEYIGNFILPCKPGVFNIYNKLKHVVK